MTINALGIDIAKNIFQLHGVDAEGKTVLRKKITRNQLPEFIAQIPICKIGMETCGSANYWATAFKRLGYEVKLAPLQKYYFSEKILKIYFQPIKRLSRINCGRIYFA